MDDIEKCTLRSFYPMAGRESASIESEPEFTSTSSEWNETFRACRTHTCKHGCRFEKIENFVKRSKSGEQGGPPSQIGPYLVALLQMREV